jgi:hypothetical protein
VWFLIDIVPPAIVMQQAEECRVVRVQQDGNLVLELRGGEQVVQLAGVQVPQPLPPAFSRVFQRLMQQGKPVRCEVQSGQRNERARVKILYYGWQDKSGDVWQDLALLLLEEGAVEVSEQEDFPDKEIYRQHQRARKP